MRLSERYVFFEWCDRHSTLLLVLIVVAVIVLAILYGKSS